MGTGKVSLELISEFFTGRFGLITRRLSRHNKLFVPISDHHFTCSSDVFAAAEIPPAVTVVEAVSGDAGDTEHAEEDEAGADDGDDCIAAALSFDGDIQ